jgi:hypothetical protein
VARPQVHHRRAFLVLPLIADRLLKMEWNPGVPGSVIGSPGLRSHRRRRSVASKWRLRMSNEERVELTARNTIMKILTNDEVAKVSTSEAAQNIAEGGEYLDLKHLEKGILHATAATHIEMGHVIPRSAVGPETWNRILKALSP